MSDQEAIWGIKLEPAICEACDWLYLLPPGRLPRLCPHCFGAELARLDEVEFSQPPELVLPFGQSPDRIKEILQRFSQDIWFAPADLNPDILQERLHQLYLPVWLVDSEVEATWEAEAGFDYEVVSHEDRYDGNGWHSHQVTEQRVRWEPRLGRLKRSYHNIPAPALERPPVGTNDYRPDQARPYTPAAIQDTIIRLPRRRTADAWPDATPRLYERAAAECETACRVHHFRHFRWKPAYRNQNWTLLLAPLYTTYYRDDSGAARPIFIEGQTGRIEGQRRASMKAAQRWSWIILGVAAAIFIISGLVGLAGVLVAPLLPVAAVGLAMALGLGLLAVLPVVYVWQFNREATRQEALYRTETGRQTYGSALS